MAKNTKKLTGSEDESVETKRARLQKDLRTATGEDRKDIQDALDALERGSQNESVEQIDEISRKTLGSYLSKNRKQSLERQRAVFNSGGSTVDQDGNEVINGSKKAADVVRRKNKNRDAGAETAIKKLTREEAESLEEASDDYRGKTLKNKALTHVNIKDGKPESAGDHGKLAVARALFGKTRLRYRGKNSGGYTLKKDAHGAAVYQREDFEQKLDAIEYALNGRVTDLKNLIGEMIAERIASVVPDIRQDMIDARFNSKKETAK